MNSVRGRLLASTMVAGVAALTLGSASQAAAQAAPANPATSAQTNGIGKNASPTEGPVEAQAGITSAADANGRTNPSDATGEVVVTGSRISSPNMKSISPVTAVSAQDFKVEGITRVEDLLNQLPQVFASQGSAISNGADGTATVNLRGLGSNRTLVLIDGRRLINGDANDPAADLNFIPTIILDRVDVDTGGASAVYGSDALAGVVNFVTKKNFQGVTLDVQWAGSQHDNNNHTIQNVVSSYGFPVPNGSVLDGQTVQIQGMMGVNSPDGKGNLSAYASYRNVDAILQGNRDYSACTLTDLSNTTFGCGGSGTAAAARIGNYAVAAGGTFIPRAQNPLFNYGPYNYYQRPDTNYKLGAFGHYEINPMADVYTQLMFMDDNSVAQIAPGGIFAGTYSINCNNAFASAAQLTALCGANAGSSTAQFTGTVARRNVEGGGRESDFRHTDYRGVVGVRGDLGNDWNYDIYGMYSTVIQNSTTLNYFSIAKIQNALQAVKNSAGQIVCASATAVAAGCVPYNIFTPGGVTQAALNYLETPAFTTGSLNEQVIEASITGKLGQYGIQSPFADEGVGIALGTDYRKERIAFQTDSESSSGDLSGTGGASPPVFGSFDVYEVYGEVRVPLVTNKPFVESLNFEGGYRYSEYSTNAGSTDTYKAGLDWTPFHDLRLRASYQHAVRAPNIDELFTPQAGGLGLVNDICAGAAVNGLVQGKYTAAQCARTGVTAAEFGNIEANPAAQYNTISGGNPNLNPETSNTYSGGFVYSPHFIGGLSLSADFFNIQVDHVIGAGLGGADTQLQQCALTGATQFCSTIHRDSTGSLFLTPQGYVLTTELNGGELQSEGIDITGDYKVPLSRFGLDNFGSIDFNYIATYQMKLRTKALPGGASYDCNGLYGSICGTPNPYYRHKMRLTWNTPYHDLQISAQWRYYGAVKADGLSDQAELTGQSDAAYAIDNHFGSQSYLDLTAAIRIRDNLTLRAGVNNLLDEEPPLSGLGAAGAFNGNTYPQVYDSVGRYLFASVTANF